MHKDHINLKPHIVEGKQVKYFNGLRWLVRETLPDKVSAAQKLDEVNEAKLKENV